MNADDMKRRLGHILTQEECSHIDWTEVHHLSDQLASELPEFTPSIVICYLQDAERRKADAVFAHAQRTELLTFLRAG